MPDNNPHQITLRDWIGRYLRTRDLSVPSGKPLYSYATSENELNFLAALLQLNTRERNSPTYGIYWAAGYCLFIAEKYRREYKANWSWQAFDTAIDVQLQPNDHMELVQRGLGFWKRPLKYHAHGTDYLGSLFAEGGLPWPLLQSEQHGFGRAINAGISNNSYAGLDTVSVVRQFDQYFPQSFRNDETYQLLASTVDTLKMLASNYGLDQIEEPAAWLDCHVPQWRENFPLPLEEHNGVALVSKWLGTVVEPERPPHFTCEHWLDGPLVSASLEARVWLSPSLQIDLKGRHISTSRVELALYEGDCLIQKLGVSYGQVDGDRLTIKLPLEVATLRRQSPEKSLFLVVSCAGERLDTLAIQSSEVDWQQLPAVFVEEESGIRLAGLASVQCQAAEVLLRAPEGMRAPSFECLLTDNSGGHWYRLDRCCELTEAEARYVIEPGQAPEVTRLDMQGLISPYSTLPAATWRGWPRCLLVDAQGKKRSPKAFRVNGRLVNSLEGLTRVGCFKVDILGEDHRLMARRKLGVLPRDFSLTAMPASPRAPARIVIRSVNALDVYVHNTDAPARIHQEGGETKVQLDSDGHTSQVQLEIREEGANAEGVVIRVPYPEEGAQLIAADGQPFKENELTLNDILGMTLTLTPPPEVPRTFFVTLELMGQLRPLIKQYRYRVHNKTAQVSLYSLYDDMLSLLSCSTEQDAKIRCRVETAQLHKQFYVCRYEASIRFNGSGEFFELVDHGAQPLMHRSEGTTVMAMQLASPESEPVSIPPQAPNGVVTGFYALPERLFHEGPWLLYPAEEASVVFRPAIHVPNPSACHADEHTSIETLHSAARYYHPQNYPEAFDRVLNEMAGQFFHPSWLYLIELKTRYANLPLSALESWKHLARHPEALALAVFRLEITPVFVDRLTHELAVTWETITVVQWQYAVQHYVKAMMQEFGLPEALIRNKAHERMSLLSSQVPVFRDFSGLLCDAGQALPGAPPLQTILPTWLNELRARHDEEEWPTNLNSPLTRWLHDQDEYAWLAKLEVPGYMHSVCFMPLFAAFLTAGEARLDLLSVDDAERRFGFRVLSDFDRHAWYEPVFSATLAGLLHAQGRAL